MKIYSHGIRSVLGTGDLQIQRFSVGALGDAETPSPLVSSDVAQSGVFRLLLPTSLQTTGQLHLLYLDLRSVISPEKFIFGHFFVNFIFTLSLQFDDPHSIPTDGPPCPPAQHQAGQS